MRSYYAHLKTASGTDKKAVTTKPIFRSSAIFPVMQYPGVSSRILFMGYWMLKRNIQQIAAVVTLRSEHGEILYRDNLLITEAKTFRVELGQLLSSSGYSQPTFYGSLEIEFFSTLNLVFPFPAVVINYYGPTFSTVVHTAQRVYNDFEDMQNNSQTSVPESGFNIYCDDNEEPFIGMINGPKAVPEATLKMQFFNSRQEVLVHEYSLGAFEAYQTRFIYPAKLVDLKTFLKGDAGSVKLQFQMNWIFPRLVVGNIRHPQNALSITHSYYDCSAARSESDYWLEAQPEWHPATLMLPVRIEEEYFTNIYFYPIYSPSIIGIDIELYDASGKLAGAKSNLLRLETPQYKKVNLKELCKELNIPADKILGARVIAKSLGAGGRIPARIKVAFDIGHSSLPTMPCNICTNLQPFNPPWETKPSTFRWAPVLADQPNASLWIMNSSPAVNYRRPCDISITFFREKDTTTLSRKLTLPPHGFCVIRPENDKELSDFFEGEIGWCTVVSTNPYTTTYYFADNPSGVVGGDHGF